MVGYQLDDSQSLHRKWLEITKHPLKNCCLGFQAALCFPNRFIRHPGFVILVSQTETNSSHRPGCAGPQKETIVFQRSIFRCYMLVSGRVGAIFWEFVDLQNTNRVSVGAPVSLIGFFGTDVTTRPGVGRV